MVNASADRTSGEETNNQLVVFSMFLACIPTAANYKRSFSIIDSETTGRGPGCEVALVQYFLSKQASSIFFLCSLNMCLDLLLVVLAIAIVSEAGPS